MTIVSFVFTKLLAERGAPYRGKISINNNVAITSLEEAKLPGTSNALKFKFKFTTSYEPSVGNILIEGELLYLAGSNAEEIVKEWKESKKLKSEIGNQVLNAILSKVNVEALLLSKEVGLPPPIPLPRIAAKQVSDKQAQTSSEEDREISKHKKSKH